MGNKLIRALWGDLSNEELKKFSLLALGFFFLIGSFWPLKILKDVVFINTVGSIFQPDAKIMSLFVFFPLVLIYSKLVDYFSKEKLLYLLVAASTVIGLVFVYFFYHPTIGLSNTSQGQHRLIGWLFYLFVESYISLMVSLYWAFISDITTPESAKKGYGMLIFGSQLGGVIFTVLGSFLAYDTSLYATRAPIIALISILVFLLVAVVVFFLTRIIAREELVGYVETKKIEESKESVGFFDGLKILIGCPYVGGIFGMVFFHEVVSALMHYQMLRTVELTFLSNQGLVNKFMFNYAFGMQTISCLFALFGTSYFQRKIGVRGCLIAYPLLLGSGVVLYLFNPTLGFITGVMVIAKGINYALNQPAKEMLYIPTTRAVKYKAKAWVDMFGLRAAKMGGSVVNKSIGVAVRATGGISIVLVVLWVLAARSVGTRYKDVIAKGERIGGNRA